MNPTAVTATHPAPWPYWPAPRDPWGFGPGTQAARINELLAADGFHTVGEVFAALAHEFPATTRARVNTHVNLLRRRHPALLCERRDGWRVAFRLLTDPPEPAAPAPGGPAAEA